MDSCYSLPFLLKCYERLGGVMSVCPRAAAARRRRGVLARAAYAMRKARYADNPRLPLARARSATCSRYHRRLPTYSSEPGREALTRSLGERSAGVVGGRAWRAALFLATFLMLLNWGPLSTSPTTLRKAESSRCVWRFSVSPGDSATASRWRGLPRAASS